MTTNIDPASLLIIDDVFAPLQQVKLVPLKMKAPRKIKKIQKNPIKKIVKKSPTKIATKTKITKIEPVIKKEDDDILILDDDVQIVQKEMQIQKPLHVEIDYDTKTYNYYKRLREQKLDPFLLDISANPFKFHFKWNPYTGERLNIDECGPLCFDPDYLIRYFWTNRLLHLWTEPTADNGVYYQGYFDDAVGKGPDFNITGRGDHPEWHLFRLPIIDCYLAKDHNDQLVTMGPLLSEKEIEEIYKLAKKNKNNYRDIFHRRRPDLLKMKYWYERAINPTPEIDFMNPNWTDAEKKQAYYQANTMAVTKLKHC